ncbi:glycosyltransferase [Dyadobacter bucti]|uniref:glycosyltransferase n=1 Tax=Dyadobacter bucti TaxID=2572203 RepID=UPI00110857A3|nr:glycosyltransferase [Dyadobacter bucti]
MSKILILGKIPPPIGGVTVHVSRLIEWLSERNFNKFEFCDIKKRSAFYIFLKILQCRSIHLHISNPYIQLLFAIFCKITFKKLLLTYHGNWGRYGYSKNIAVNLSACLAYIPIVQNEESLVKAKWWNRNTVLISTFIRSKRIKPLHKELSDKILHIRKACRMLFCTNAWNLTFDKEGKEIYGILDIVLKIANTPGAGLVISDPSGNYQPYVKRHCPGITANIIFISENHDFRNVLALSDAFIRNTTTDGVSLSIHEAIEKNVVVLASDVVRRPAMCRLYTDFSKVNLEEELHEGRQNLNSSAGSGSGPDTLEMLMQLYNRI